MKYSYKDKVIIAKGFYKDCVGEVVEYRPQPMQENYVVKLDDGVLVFVDETNIDFVQ